MIYATRLYKMGLKAEEFGINVKDIKLNLFPGIKFLIGANNNQIR